MVGHLVVQFQLAEGVIISTKIRLLKLITREGLKADMVQASYILNPQIDRVVGKEWPKVAVAVVIRNDRQLWEPQRASVHALG